VWEKSIPIGTFARGKLIEYFNKGALTASKAEIEAIHANYVSVNVMNKYLAAFRN
jgi:hypothetical protein